MNAPSRVGVVFAIGLLGAAALGVAAWGREAPRALERRRVSGSTQAPEDRFGHARHNRLFPLCSTCHAGVTQPGQAVFPSPTACASCHDGVIQPRVTWQARTAGLPTRNLRFTHE
ncbi:MAG TPA: hypothetical protein VL263_16890, partial [Vicinamibacterales bacterium]|nr:hypothetical protein [Vicinamibacterales bacterium]